MALLSRYRRFWSIGIVAVLTLPAFGHFLPDVPAPPPPVTWLPGGYWRRAAEQLDPYINSSFGFRGVFLAVHGVIGRLSSRHGPVVIGEDEQMFYLGDNAIEKALGLNVEADGLIDGLVSAARMMADIQASHGGRFLVTSPPDGATVLMDRLPQWLRVQARRPTNYEVVMRRLNEAGISTFDLRPVLSDARTDGPVYFRTDTHWNSRGHVLAFNAVMRALDRPDLAFDPSRILGPLRPAATGDLTRLAGRREGRDDANYPIQVTGDPFKNLTNLPLPAARPNSKFLVPPVAQATQVEGPSILVVGDSFTYAWRELMPQRFKRFAWIHYESCSFDRGWIERFKPDILIFAPTERQLRCQQTPYTLASDPRPGTN